MRNNSLFVCRDQDDTIVLYSRRPSWNVEGRWELIEGSGYLFELIEEQAQDLFGFVPEARTCHEITVITTLIEKVDA